MSERMTDAEFLTRVDREANANLMNTALIIAVAEAKRARAAEEEKDAEIKALTEALRKAERAMSNSPAFNPWDLGPHPTLVEVRSVLGLHPDKRGT